MNRGNLELASKNLRAAKKRWGINLNKTSLEALKYLSREYGFAVLAGDLVYLDHGWYVTHSGLLRLARRRQCVGIETQPELELCDVSANRWAFRATAYKSAACKGFFGYGDADPTNVSSLVRGAEMRIAETRAVNRALRKAYGIGLCSIEEIGSTSGPSGPVQQQKQPKPAAILNVNGNGHHLRDRLLVLIRQQKLDGALVKAYAADFCDVKELRDASKEQIQQFIQHLSEYATNDRDGLLCQLNSYALKQESAA